MKNKNKNRKRALFISSVMLVIALLITGTFAWQDYSQHKSNEFNTASVEHNVVLVEDFEPVENWRVNESKDKTIFVKNGSSDDPKGVYDQAYIRLQLKEYMDISKRDYEYSLKRYLIDTKGDFIRFESKDEALAFIAKSDNGYGHKTEADIELVKSPFDKNDKGYYYIVSEQNDINGQYGKHVVIAIKNSDYVPVIEGTERVKESVVSSQHHAGESEECNYPTHIWKEDQNSLLASSAIDEYVGLGLSEDVVTLEQYRSLSKDKKDAGVWVLDTSNDLGYAYWNQALKHVSEDGSGRTKNFLNDVTLLKQPQDTAYYILHVDMEAISYDDLDHWYNMPEILASEWGTEVYQGEISLKIDGKIKAGTAKPLKVSGLKPDKSPIKEFDIQVEGTDNPRYEAGEIITTELEEGPIKVTVKPKDTSLHLNKTVTIEVEPYKVELPTITDETTFQPSEEIRVEVLPANKNYEYQLSANSSPLTKIDHQGYITLADDENSDELVVTVSLKGKKMLEQVIKLGHVTSIEFNDTVKTILYRNQDVDFSATVSGNKYLEDHSVEYSIHTNERSIKGISIDKETGVLHVDKTAAINQPFTVVACSQADKRKKVEYKDVVVLIDKQEIDDFVVTVDKNKIKPMEELEVSVQFFKDDELVANIPYEIMVDSNEVEVNGNKIKLSENFRNETLSIKVTTRGVSQELEKEIVLDMKQLLDFDLSIEETVVNGAKYSFSISEDRIGQDLGEYEFTFNRDQDKVAVTKDSSLTYTLSIDKNIDLGDLIMTVKSKENSELTKNISLNVLANQDYKDEVASWILPEDVVLVHEDQYLDLLDYIQTFNIYGESIAQLSDLDIRLEGSKLSIIEDGYLVIDKYEKERDLKIYVSMNESEEDHFIIRVRPKVKDVTLMNTQGYQGEIIDLKPHVKGYYLDHLTEAKLTLTFEDGSRVNVNGSSLDADSATLHIDASEPEGKIMINVAVIGTDIKKQIPFSVYTAPEKTQLKIINKIPQSIDFSQGFEHQYEVKVKNNHEEALDRTIKYKVEAKVGYLAPGTRISNTGYLKIDKNQLDAEIKVIASTGIHNEIIDTDIISSKRSVERIEVLNNTMYTSDFKSNQQYNFYFKALDKDGLVLHRTLDYHIEGNVDETSHFDEHGVLHLGANEIGSSIKVYASYDNGDKIIHSRTIYLFVQANIAKYEIGRNTIRPILRPGEEVYLELDAYLYSGYPTELVKAPQKYIKYQLDGWELQANYENGLLKIDENTSEGSSRASAYLTGVQNDGSGIFYEFEVRPEIAQLSLEKNHKELYPNQTIELLFDAKDRKGNKLNYVNKWKDTERHFEIVSGHNSALIKDNLLTISDNPQDDTISIKGYYKDPLTNQMSTMTTVFPINKAFRFKEGLASAYQLAKRDEQVLIEFQDAKGEIIDGDITLVGNYHYLTTFNQETKMLSISKYEFRNVIKLNFDSEEANFNFVIPLLSTELGSSIVSKDLPETIAIPKGNESKQVAFNVESKSEYQKEIGFKYSLLKGNNLPGVSINPETGVLTITNQAKIGSAIVVRASLQSDDWYKVDSQEMIIGAGSYKDLILDYDESVLSSNQAIAIKGYRLIDYDGQETYSEDFQQEIFEINTNSVHPITYQLETSDNPARLQMYAVPYFTSDTAYLDLILNSNFSLKDYQGIKQFEFDVNDVIYTNIYLDKASHVYKTNEEAKLIIDDEVVGKMSKDSIYEVNIYKNGNYTTDVSYENGKIKFNGNLKEGETQDYTINVYNSCNSVRSNTLTITFKG